VTYGARGIDSSDVGNHVKSWAPLALLNALLLRNTLVDLLWSWFGKAWKTDRRSGT
jgi:hypothetical protein